MSDDVRVVLRLRARPETVEQLKPVLFDLAGASSKEDGCHSYKVFQNQSDPLDFVLYETWRDQPSLDAHLTTAHVAQAFAKDCPCSMGRLTGRSIRRSSGTSTGRVRSRVELASIGHRQEPGGETGVGPA